MKKQNLVLLPGLLNDYRLFEQQIAWLADVTIATVPDLTNANSMSQLAAQTLEQAPEGEFVLAGLSMGGYLALEIIRQAPERVSALALLDTSARPDTPEATANRNELIKLAETDLNAVIEKLIPKLIHPSQLNDARQINAVKAMADTLGKDVFIRQQQAIIGRIDSRPYLKDIECPTLILCGQDDVITPLEVHEELHQGIKNSKLVTIENCGHLSTIGQPQEVTAALRDWLKSINQ
ncbi:MAG: alpha/beta hydrolase [Gammaproteobacteria bacterium]|nr:MAG: alpha/beta hydrolase [Gammaproteobacteria bacterium]